MILIRLLNKKASKIKGVVFLKFFYEKVSISFSSSFLIIYTNGSKPAKNDHRKITTPILYAYLPKNLYIGKKRKYAHL
ncbi:hypothetical protein COV42_03110 [Candidatus Campbellbacteria bacterium CG11_big_fil_rev_8_21_14_0_20_44_21]|nr:MAG: hypothetical protein COV42_03110 [Candidatus Campbellbacteria bacterium CG11_big_fil_rev_8_21_14_0_20_44_21]